MNRLPFTSSLAITVTAICLSLGGCNSTPKERIVYRDRLVEVPTPCKTDDVETPAYAESTVDLNADIFTIGRAIMQGRAQRKAETTELRAANKACN